MCKRYEISLDSYKGESVARLTIRNSNQHNRYYDSIRSNRECLGEDGMKLSEKGFKALLHKVRSGFFWGYEDDIHKAKDHDFKPDDFKGVVCLTVDEAKDVLHSLNCTWSRCPVKVECKDLIKKKIKQAEGN